TGSATRFNPLLRSIGPPLSAAVVGVVLSHLTTGFGPVALPSLVGFRTGMVIGCAVSLTAAAVASSIPLRRAAPPPPPTTPTTVPAADHRSAA
ncbi:MFS transporter, partial [Streptacidiphilus pinicola]